jgi:predicted transposase YdaD
MGESQVANRWRAEGRNQGQQEGQQEGQLEGRLEGRRSALVEILQTRFQATVRADLMSAINMLTDQVELARWIKTAAAASSLEEFRTTVGR